MLICIHTVLQDMYPDSCHISQKGWLAIAAAAIYFCLNFSPSEKYFLYMKETFSLGSRNWVCVVLVGFFFKTDVWSCPRTISKIIIVQKQNSHLVSGKSVFRWEVSAYKVLF